MIHKILQRNLTVFEQCLAVLVLTALIFLSASIYSHLRQETRQSIEQINAGAIRNGILIFFLDTAHGNGSRFPTEREMDSAAVGRCSASNRCFAGVLEGDGITKEWTKLGENTWRSSVSKTNVWTYQSQDGSFAKTAS